MTRSLFPSIDWVGYVDWTIRDFHGYHTSRGSSYNSYLVRDTKSALIDTVKASYACHLLKSVSDLLPLDKLDYLVVNHAEPDHGGSVAAVVKACPQVTVVTNEKCRAILSGYHDTSDWNWQLVGTGDTLELDPTRDRDRVLPLGDGLGDDVPERAEHRVDVLRRGRAPQRQTQHRPGGALVAPECEHDVRRLRDTRLARGTDRHRDAGLVEQEQQRRSGPVRRSADPRSPSVATIGEHDGAVTLGPRERFSIGRERDIGNVRAL